MSYPPFASPAVQADTLRLFADVMIPGDDLFPAASKTGAHGLLAERLRETGGADAVHELVDALERHGGGVPFIAHAMSGRIRAVAALEQADSGYFAHVRSILYYSYYQHPLVVDAIRSLGFAYNDAPQPRGYALPRFDPLPGGDEPPASTPGWYKRTGEVVRVDISGITGTNLAARQRHG